MKTFAVLRQPGPAWIQGKPTRQQPLWDEHAAFMDRIFETGAILLAGPYADHSSTLLIIQAEDEAAVQTMFRDDPWTVQQILDAGQAREWTIFLDSRQRE
jgi:uncharacterized protein YciI